jgi:hypothetical protein
MDAAFSWLFPIRRSQELHGQACGFPPLEMSPILHKDLHLTDFTNPEILKHIPGERIGDVLDYDFCATVTTFASLRSGHRL